MSEVTKKLRVKLKTLQVQFSHLSTNKYRGVLYSFRVGGAPRDLSERWNCCSLKKRNRIMFLMILMMMITMLILIDLVRRMMKKKTICAQAVMRIFLPIFSMRTYDLYQLCQQKQLPIMWFL